MFLAFSIKGDDSISQLNWNLGKYSSVKYQGYVLAWTVGCHLLDHLPNSSYAILGKKVMHF